MRPNAASQTQPNIEQLNATKCSQTQYNEAECSYNCSQMHAAKLRRQMPSCLSTRIHAALAGLTMPPCTCLNSTAPSDAFTVTGNRPIAAPQDACRRVLLAVDLLWSVHSTPTVRSSSFFVRCRTYRVLIHTLVMYTPMFFSRDDFVPRQGPPSNRPPVHPPYFTMNL